MVDPAGPVVLNPRGRSAYGARHVVLHAEASRHHVEGFEGPASIKTVVRGQATWQTAGGRFVLDDASYLVLSPGRRYTIDISAATPVETFCVFFRDGSLAEALASLSMPGRLLDDPDRTSRAPEFLETVRPHDQLVSGVLRRLRHRLSVDGGTALWVEERIQDLVLALVDAERLLWSTATAIEARRPATRFELLRRVLRARDFVEACLPEQLPLARMAREACLSPFHFHRVFTQVFRETPHAYVTRRRLERGRGLLLSGRRVGDASMEVGFESHSAFSQRFRRRFGTSPGAVRRSGLPPTCAGPCDRGDR